MLTGRVRFDRFEVDPSTGELWRDGTKIPVQDLPFKLLVALLERPGALVTRADLSARLWGSETFVDATAGLNTAVAKLREALGDSAEAPTFVETVPKRGYRFIAAVEAAGARPDTDAAADPPPEIASAVRAKPTHVRMLTWTAVALAAFLAIVLAAYQLRADRGRVRVAVVLFDNETGQADLGRLAQGLTDATVTELTADARLAVIGNAAVLRTERPFRDIARVRDTLDADYIVIGQVQTVDAQTIVRTHLIRADESHLTVNVSTLTPAGEGALQREVSSKVRAAVDRALDSR